MMPEKKERQSGEANSNHALYKIDISKQTLNLHDQVPTDSIVLILMTNMHLSDTCF
jgi:hypothetical protein